MALIWHPVRWMPSARRGFVAEIELKPDAKPVARRPYRLSDFDEARLECRLEEERLMGKLEDVDMPDPKEALEAMDEKLKALKKKLRG